MATQSLPYELREQDLERVSAAASGNSRLIIVRSSGGSVVQDGSQNTAVVVGQSDFEDIVQTGNELTVLTKGKWLHKSIGG
jgi:hypothetical protein